MLKINRLREFLLEIKTAIPAIKSTQVIISDSDFKQFLKERKISDNTNLFVVAPNHGIVGREDASKYDNQLQFFFFDKIVEKDLKYDAKLDLYNKIQGIVQQFMQYLLDAKSGENEDFNDCGLFQYLDEESVDIVLFWDGFECRGYEVFFSLKTN